MLCLNNHYSSKLYVTLNDNMFKAIKVMQKNRQHFKKRVK